MDTGSGISPPPPDEPARDFERLFKLYYRPVLGFFLKRGFSGSEGEDLAQETFANALRGLTDFRRDTSELGWLFAIARNVLNNEIRRRKSLKREMAVVSLESLREGSPDWEHTVDRGSDDVLDKVVDGEHRALLGAALEELPQRRRQALHLRIFQGLKYREIAGVLQMDVNTAKSHVSQGKAQLKALLGAAPTAEGSDGSGEKDVQP